MKSLNHALPLCFAVALLVAPSGRIFGQVREWQLDEKPFVSIGSVDGDERNTLSAVSGVLVFPDGRMAIAERVGARIRVYSKEGLHIGDWGRRGEGPGEYQYVRSLALYRGDSIAVHDMGLRRITILDSAGLFGRSINLRLNAPRVAGIIPSQSCCMLVGALSDGTFIAATPEAIPVTPGGPRYSMQAFYRVSVTGSRVDSIGAWPGALYSYDASAPNRIRNFHFSPYPAYAIANDRLLVGNGAAYRIERVRFTIAEAIPDGAVLGARALRPVTKAIRDAYEADIRRSYRESPERYEGPLENYLRGAFPETLPAYFRLLADPSGNVWVTIPNYNRARAEPTRIDVFDTAGRPIATLQVSAGRQIAAVTNDALVAIERDELGVEYVRVYRIRKR